MSKYMNLYFFIALFAIAYSYNIKLIADDDIGLSRTLKSSFSVLYFSFDDEVTEIFINDQKISLDCSEQEAKKWNVVHQQVLILFPGDVLTVKGRDLYGGKSWFVGTLYYMDPKGIEHIINTNNQWECNGKSAIQFQEISADVSFPHEKINNKAQKIWDSLSTIPNKVVSCSIKIPCY